jgi:hypothetical protein
MIRLGMGPESGIKRESYDNDRGQAIGLGCS